MSYDLTLRKRFIRDFIRKHERAPTKAEILVGVQALRDQHVNLENRGFSAADVSLPKFLSESSAEAERVNREAIVDDLQTLSNSIRELSQKLEDDYRSFRLKLGKLKRLATYLESGIDDLLLSLGLEDAFTSAFTEDFVSLGTRPGEATTALIEDGYCVAGREALKKIPLSGAEISFTATSDTRILSRSATSPAQSVLDIDGQTYEYIVVTDKQRATVNLIVTVTMPEARPVGEVRVTSTLVRSHSEETYSAFYSVDGTDYKLLEPGARPYNQGNLVIPVSQPKVKSIRLVFTKRVADSRTTLFNQWAFGWQFDAIELFEQSFGANQTYVFEAPYELQGGLGSSKISKVTLEVCTIEPPGTGISWFVSGDGKRWSAINPYKKALDVVSLRSRVTDGLGLLDPTKDAAALLNPRNYASGFMTDPNVYVLNTYFANNYIPDKHEVELLLDVFTADRDSGWNINSAGNYEIWVYIATPEGKYFNLGPRGAKIDGRVVSGRVWFKPGWSRFETTVDNYAFVDSGATDEDVLRVLDPLYPFNHKYVIEGYDYDVSYEGPQVYSGVDAGAGKVVRYLEPDDFETATNLWTWTTESMPGLGTVLLVRVDPTAAHFLDSTNSFTWTGIPNESEGENSNLVYVRALLQTSSTGLSPIIDWFTIRGI